MELNKSGINYHQVIVNKPWGREYLMYENGTVGIWFLHIEKDARTSMHCHPHKKTGLILLSGEAVLSFLNDSTRLKPISKMMIREGLFHSTQAVSEGGVSIIEVETPCDKTNLVRLDDEYGREEKPYEGKDSIVPMTKDCLTMNHPKEGRPEKYSLSGCILSAEKITEIKALRERPAGEIVTVLDGGLYSKTDEPVLNPGDVVSSDTLHRLAERFYCPKGISILSIKKEKI
ncbi:MAG: hypothetical protein HYT97_01705 [Elusimicrobia bacterium]|nr:hypothetical protein [Elusimicrobiota bacterium]